MSNWVDRVRSVHQGAAAGAAGAAGTAGVAGTATAGAAGAAGATAGAALVGEAEAAAGAALAAVPPERHSLMNFLRSAPFLPLASALQVFIFSC